MVFIIMATASSADNLTYNIRVTIAPPEDDPSGERLEYFGPDDMVTACAIAEAEDAARVYDVREREDYHRALREAASISHDVHGIDYSARRVFQHRDTFVLEEKHFQDGTLKCRHLRQGANRECGSGDCYVLVHRKNCNVTRRKFASKRWKNPNDETLLWVPAELRYTRCDIYYVGEEGVQK